MPKYMSNTSLILEKLEELYDNLLLFGNTDTLIQYGSLFLKKGADNKWELGSVDASHIDGCFEIPAFISRINEMALFNLSGLTAITFEEGSILESIKNRAFLNCKNLIYANLPDTCEHIGCRAFEDCSNLKEVILPLGLKCLDSFAFENCNSLQSIRIPLLTCLEKQ